MIKIKREEIPAVAVCFIRAYAYPQHELQAREILAEALPGVSITLSHEVAREWREYERASTAIMNAYIAPTVERYLSKLIQGIIRFSLLHRKSKATRIDGTCSPASSR
ncbi:MAG: hypothetical protein ACUVXI_08700 [bacterium]